jgi:tetratricopeptide (TPR) repeat protein
MKISSGWQNAGVVATVFCISGCTSNSYQSTTKNLPSDKTVGAEQAEWKRLTATADAAAKKHDYAAAEKDYQTAVLEAEKLGIDTPQQAEALANLANFYYVQGNGAQADGLYKQSLTIKEKALGLQHKDLVTDLIGLARACHSEKKDDDAVTHFGRAIWILNREKQPVPADVTAEYTKLLKAQVAAKAAAAAKVSATPATAPTGSEPAKADSSK